MSTHQHRWINVDRLWFEPRENRKPSAYALAPIAQRTLEAVREETDLHRLGYVFPGPGHWHPVVPVWTRSLPDARQRYRKLWVPGRPFHHQFDRCQLPSGPHRLFFAAALCLLGGRRHGGQGSGGRHLEDDSMPAHFPPPAAPLEMAC